jgi:hypothetical protein
MPISAWASGIHGAVRATITIGPQMPSVGQAWRITASFPAADRRLHPARRVEVIGEMTGHPMRPVEAELSPTGEPGTFSGVLHFTMRGPWMVTLRVEDLNDVMTGALEVNVVREDQLNGLPDIRSVLDLHQPARPNLVPPVWVVIATIALVLGSRRATGVIARYVSPHGSSRA